MSAFALLILVLLALVLTPGIAAITCANRIDIEALQRSFAIWVNGRYCFVPVNRRVHIPEKYLAVLLRSPYKAHVTVHADRSVEVHV